MSDDKNQNPQRKGGRRSKYKPEFCDRVRELGAEGRSKVQIAARLGVNKGTLLNWIESYPEFKEAMEEAEDLGQSWWEDCGQAGLDRRDFNSQAYSFQMRNRFAAYREVSRHELTGLDGTPLTGDQPSSGDLAKALMFLFGEGTVMVPKSGQTNEIHGPEIINGALSMIGNGSAPAEPTTKPSALSFADAAEAQPQDSATPQARTGLAPGESEVFDDNGAVIVLDAERKKYAIFDSAGTFHNWRRDYNAACEFARTLK